MPVSHVVERLREEAAARYPTHLTDTMGREHRCIPREAILRGDWDAALIAAEQRSPTPHTDE